MIRVSPTQIKKAKECLRKWFLEYRMGQKQATREELTYGSLFHEFLETYHMGVPVKDIFERINQCINIYHTDKSMMINMVKAYIDYDESVKDEYRRIPKTSEAEFLFEHKIEDSELFMDLGVVVEGKVDMTFKQDKRIVIVEHKTSSKPWSMIDFYTDSQVEMYHVLMSRYLEKQKQEGCKIEVMFNIVTKPPGKIIVQREIINRMNVRDNTEMMKQAVEMIVRTKELPYRCEGKHCNWCDYSDICIAGNNIVSIANVMQFKEV